MENWKKRLEKLHKEVNGDELFGNCASHNEGLSCCTEKKWLLDFIEQEIEKAREEVIMEIYNFVEGESGRSGRKEILEFISKLTTK